MDAPLKVQNLGSWYRVELSQPGSNFKKRPLVIFVILALVVLAGLGVFYAAK